MICRGEWGMDGWSGLLWSPESAKSRLVNDTIGRHVEGGPHCPPDSVHKGPPRAAPPPSPLRMVMGFFLG